MKKTKLLSILCVVGVASIVSFSACENGGEGGIEMEDVKTVVSDENAWNSMFENIEYSNYSVDVFEYIGNSENYAYGRVTENAITFNETSSGKTYREYFCFKNIDGTYTNYYRQYSLDGEKGDLILSEDTSGYYYDNFVNSAVFRFSFADYFDLFTYDETISSYCCETAIEATAYDSFTDSTINMSCTDNVIKVENDKIVSLSCSFFLDYGNDSVKYTVKYFDFGSTIVSLSEEDINNAVPEE